MIPVTQVEFQGTVTPVCEIVAGWSADTIFRITPAVDDPKLLAICIRSRAHPRRKFREIWRGKPAHLTELALGLAQARTAFARMK